LQNPVLAAAGQTVTKDGAVMGQIPRTNTFGFRWNAMSSALTSMAQIAESEWRAEQLDTPEARKEVAQFVWAEPYREKAANVQAFTAEMVLAKIGQHRRGVAPTGTAKLTVFIDVGLYRCWWAAWAWRLEGQGYLIDYGCIEVPQGRQTSPLAILASLRTFRDDVLRPGWVLADGNSGAVLTPDLVLIDAGYEPDVAAGLAAESGGRFLPSKGLGSAKDQRSWTAPKAAKHRQVGHEWVISVQPNGSRLVEMHADYWKRQIHEGFAAPLGQPGSLHLFHAEARDHGLFARQIAAERQEEEFLPGRGLRVYWNRTSKANHYLDCSYGARCAADMVGIRVLRPAVAATAGQEKRTEPHERTGRTIRTRY